MDFDCVGEALRMRAFLFLAGMILFSLLLGTGVLSVLYGRDARKFHMADRLLAGFMAILGLAEAAHLAAVFLGRSFSDVVLLFVVGMAALSVFSAGVWIWLRTAGKERRVSSRKGAEVTPFVAGLFLVFALSVIYQIVTVTSGDSVYRTGDMTVETVESFLETDVIYSVNPLTGRAYEGGVPLRIRIIGLPSLYGMLCRIFGLDAVELVWRLMPLFTLLMSYLAFWLLARTFFAEKNDGRKRLLFMALVAVVFCVGDYLYGMDGFGLLYCGARGVTLRGIVFLPYAFGATLRHKWRLAVLCILAEVCVVWTLYGMGACLAVTLGIAALRMWRKSRVRSFPEIGEE